MKKEGFVTVKVNSTEACLAGLYGIFRNVQSFKNGAKDKHGCETSETGWQVNIMACISEMAFAKWRNLYYNAGIGNYFLADVNNYYQIRCSPINYINNACLRLHKEDKADLPYVLALVDVDKVIFPGWLYGHEGKQEKFWCDRWQKNRPAYFVEQKDLHPMEDLP